MNTDLSNLLCYQLFQLVKLTEQLIDKNMLPLQLSRTQWKVIARFNFLPTPCSQQELLLSMHIDRGHLTRTLEQLEKRDLIKKERLSSDKRAYNLFLTPLGLNLLAEIEDILKSISDNLTTDITKSEKKIIDKAIKQMKNQVLIQLENNCTGV